MNIVLIDVPAVTSGALTILMEYYNYAKLDKENHWTFIVSKPILEPCNNITIIRKPWIKKSWIHRIVFDIFFAKKIINKQYPNHIISLQNTMYDVKAEKKILYLHQSLPFLEKQYSIFHFKLWMNQKIISKFILKSLKISDEIIVQTNWMKEKCQSKYKIDHHKIKVEKPHPIIKVSKKYDKNNMNTLQFFYPATPLVYKNHLDIVKAALLLKKQGIENYQIFFTIKGNENNYARKISKIVKKNNLPIIFLGNITLEQVYNFYSNSILLFPSLLESLGLPLMEAKLHFTPIIAAHTLFGHEVLEGYKNCFFYDLGNSSQLAKMMVDNFIVVTKKNA